MSAATQSLLARLRHALPGWAGGVLTGLQGLILSYLVILLPVFVAVAAAPNLDGSATVDWTGGAGVATRVWLLGLGVPLPVAGGSVSLVPLGVPLVAAALLAAIARRFAAKSWTSWALACAVFSGGAVTIAVTGPHGHTAAAPEAVQAGLLAFVIAAPSVAFGIWRQYGAHLGLLDRVPDEIRAGLRLGAVTLALVVVAASAVGGAWAVLGRDAIAETASSLGADPLGGIALAAGETLYVPTMVAWMVAYLVGHGFAVGQGTLYAPSTVTPGDLPAVPLLGALPSDAGGWWVWVPALVVAAGLVARLLLVRRLRSDWDSARAAGVGLAAVALGLGGLCVVSQGSLGAGRLAAAGAEALPVASLGTAWVAVGYALGWGIVLGWGRLRRGRAAVSSPRRDDAPVPVGAATGA